MDEAIEAEQLT